MPFERDSIGRKWRLEVNYERGYEIQARRGYDVYPPNWKEFKKLMDGMMEKVRENSQ